MEQGWTFEDVADVFGNSPNIVRKHYAEWSRGPQERITDEMKSVFARESWYISGTRDLTAI